MSLRHAVLGLLVDQPASGYDLMKLFETSLAHAWHATQSQVYGELAKLAAAGLVTASAEGPRGRKEYDITEAGRAELRHWLTQTEPERIRRNDSLLRVFFLGTLAPSEARGYLVAEAERGASGHAALLDLERTVDWGDDALSQHGRLALEYGLRFTAMQEEWARWAARQIAEASGEAPAARTPAAAPDA